MSAKLTREIYWVCGTGLLTVLIGLWIFGNNVFDPTPIDIQLHDTYYVVSKSLLLTVIFIGLLITTYVTRGIYFKLDNKIITGILAVFLLISFVGQILYLNWVAGVERHFMGLYPREMDKEIQQALLSNFKITRGTLWAFLMITGTMLAAAGYKTFKPRA